MDAKHHLHDGLSRGRTWIRNARFSDPVKREAFTAALDLPHPGAAMEALTLFDQWWAHIRCNTYVWSISDHEDTEDSHGRLSMWRAFGGTLPKVGIVIRVPFYSGGAQHLHIIFSTVAYVNQQELHATANAVIENIEASAEFLRTLDRQVVIGNIFAMLLGAVTCVKHEGFQADIDARGGNGRD